MFRRSALLAIPYRKSFAAIPSVSLPRESFRVIFNLSGYFHFCKVIFENPPKIPFKTSIKVTSLGLFKLARLFLPCKVKG